MKINIKNEKQLRRFYNKIWIYRSILFCFIKFDLVNDKYNIINIINALNLKRRKERIDYIYDEAYNQINDFYKNKKTCCFKNGVCKNNIKDGCCRYCFYLNKDSCSTRNIACKMYMCSKVTCERIEYKDIKILKCLSIKQNYILKNDYFSLEESVKKDLKYNSLIIAVFRMYGRYIYNFIKNKIAR